MKIVRQAIRFPVSTAVGVILLLLFSGLALVRLPIQLTPDVVEPQVTITTFWPGASPREIEREIVDKQEEQLKSLEGLLRMESSSQDSLGTVTLSFPVGSDIDGILLRVANRLEQVQAYPADADKPVITTAGASDNAIAWFILRPLPGGEFRGEIAQLYDFVDDFIKPEIERVEGIAGSNFFGGQPREMQVIADPSLLAARRITLTQLRDAIERENRNFSAGDFSEGKRRYVVRTVGEYESPEDIEDIVIAVENGVPVYLRDVARAELGYSKVRAQVFQAGEQVIAINAIRSTGANVLQVMAGVKATVERLNRDLLRPRGLEMFQVFDQTEYIESSISLVRQSLLVGGTLAILVLLLFLRSVTSTFVVAVAIPISIVGSFLAMFWLGRTLNVVSLAGLAFAVGMVVDNSIVVLENIYRKRQLGRPRYAAADEGATEVWGAILASTLTTIAVFLPIVFMQEEVGQLFGDIAIAITTGVGLSLIVSLTVIPSLSARILRVKTNESSRPGWLRGRIRPASRVASLVGWINLSVMRRLAVVVVLVSLSVGIARWLMPKPEYLPTGNQNFLFGIILPPPGYSVEEVAQLRLAYDERLAPLWEAPEGSPEAAALPGGGVQGFFYVALADRAFMGVRARDPMRVRELIPEFLDAGRTLPGTLVVLNQSGIFQRGLDEGRNIDIDFTGPELETLIALGGEAFGKVMGLIPGAQARPIPSLDLGNPEVHVRTHRRRAAELGISNRDLGFAVSALIDGARASDFKHLGKEIDLTVIAWEGWGQRTHLLEQVPIATPGGGLVNLGSVAQIVEAGGPVQINHRERQRAITIRLTPPEDVPLGEAMELIETEILAPMEREGRLGGLYQASLSGTADKLAESWRALRMNLVLAVIITYLLLAALFESFLYPFVIMFSVPLAAMGGFLGLTAVNAFLGYQPLDVLTMLGFVILIGTVVNNPILIVHQALRYMRDGGHSRHSAIRQAVENRVRPIFMSVSTSVFGMLPLVIFPGPGSELYRGLGSVVVGGLMVSTLFTVFLVPALFSLVLDTRSALAGLVRRFTSGWQGDEAVESAE
jgi:hydrophobic/amphiphilic exporter-1 (mainly G- bacteria), HAE1 family